MCEENKINPADLNGDGKVTFKEQIQYAAQQAMAKAEELTEQVKESEAFAKTKEFAAQASDKTKELAAKAGAKADEITTKIKESEAYGKVSEKAADLKEDAKEAFDKAKDKIEDIFD